MRFLLPALIFLAPMAYAEPPPLLSATGDYDGDGEPDTVRQVSEGESVVLEITLSTMPDEPVRLPGKPGEEPDLLETKPPGSYASGSRALPVLIDTDVIEYGWKDGRRMILFHGATGFKLLRLNPSQSA